MQSISAVVVRPHHVRFEQHWKTCERDLRSHVLNVLRKTKFFVAVPLEVVPCAEGVPARFPTMGEVRIGLMRDDGFREDVLVAVAEDYLLALLRNGVADGTDRPFLYHLTMRWTKRMARRRAATLLRQALPIEPVTVVPSERVLSWWPSPESSLGSRESLLALRREMDMLSEDQRSLLLRASGLEGDEAEMAMTQAERTEVCRLRERLRVAISGRASLSQKRANQGKRRPRLKPPRTPPP